MKDMRKLQQLGAVSEEYMAELERSMKQEQSLAQFQAHLERVSARPSQDVYRGSGGNSGSLSRNQRKRKRKQQKKARCKSRVSA